MVCSYSKEYSASSFTDVENLFIYEYMPQATGDAVKVYLYGLFLCKNQNFDSTLEKIAKTLNMQEEKVIDCFMFWEEFGLVSIISKNPFTVNYLPVRTAFSGKSRKFKPEKYTDFTKGVQLLISNRMISTSEYSEYFAIMETYGIKQEAMLMIIKYCVDRKGNDIGYKYISKVAKDFGVRGIVTMEMVEKELSSYIMRTSEIQKILSALSVKRQPEIEDLNYLKKWTGELNFETENIIYAASSLKKSSMAKLDEFLLELYSTKSFSKEEIKDFKERKEKIYQLAININKALSIYVDVLDTVIDTYVNKWVSYGYGEEALLYIASYCFKNGNNTLQQMDELVESLRQKGLIDLSSVGDHFENINKTDEFIKKVLLTAGINRRPTPWDRDNLNTWKSWNFSEEMILEAAKLSAGKSSAIPYMVGILSNWKNKGVYTLNGIETTPISNGEISIADYNREYEKRRSLAISKAQKNYEKAMNLEGFATAYSRLNSIEKDMAFAEINGNNEALITLENEKANLEKIVSNLLAKIKLTIKDLSPIYSCKKCNDTGYVGNQRCTCFNK